MNFVSPSQNYWDRNYQNLNFNFIPNDGYLRKWLEHYFSNGNLTAFEVGCFPGGYLAIFGKLGYELNGIDLTPRVNSDLPQWLASQGYRLGKFYQDDFLKFKTNKKFDVVYSLGFLEHFTNWEEVVIKQAELVNPNGYLVVGVPNFRGGLQRALHYLFDRDNYYKHYLPAMNYKKWRTILESQGFKIIFSGYIGQFDFWAAGRLNPYFSKFGLPIISWLKKNIKFNHGFFSPYICLLARKAD
jgi:SAM-dependent methyltransferase